MSLSEEIEGENETNDSHEDFYNNLSDIRNEDTVSSFQENNKELWLSQQSKNIKYKPTPIAELRKRHIPITTAPSMMVSQHLKDKIEDIRKPKVEYHPGAFHTNQATLPSLYKATKINDSAKSSTDSRELLLNTILHKGAGEEDNLSQLGDDSEEEIDFDQISTAFNFLDEFLSDFDNQPKHMLTSEKFKNNANDKNIIRNTNNSRSSQNIVVTKPCNVQFENSLISCNENASNITERNCLPKKDVVCLNHQEKQIESEQTLKSSHKENNDSFSSVNKANSSSERKDHKSKLLTHQNNIQKNGSNSNKRTSEHLSETNKEIKRHKTGTEPRDDKLVNRDIEKDSRQNKNKLENVTSEKKENDKNVSKSSKKETEHRRSSTSSSRRDSSSKSSSSRSSKKESEHKNSNSKESQSQHVKSSSKVSKEKSLESKKEPTNSHKEHHFSNKSKDDSRSKRSSSDKSSSSGKHKEAKHRKENDKRERPEKRRNTQSDNDDNRGKHSSHKKKSKLYCDYYL